ncbi:MAG: PAS domain S-box protein [Nitrospirae bacterium]|nr:PAS domain S-box protein [Nitrospirota bacterium]
MLNTCRHDAEETSANVEQTKEPGKLNDEPRYEITGRPIMEEAFKKSEGKYRHLVELAHAGICTIDKNACITFVNPGMAEMLGYTVEQMHGAQILRFMNAENVELARNDFQLRTQGISENHDFELIRKDGTTIYASIESTPLLDEQGQYDGALAVVADITHRKKAEIQLSKESKLNAAIAELSSTLLESISTEEITGKILSYALRLTNSKYGYAGYVDPGTNRLVCPAYIGEVFTDNTENETGSVCGLDKFKGLWGWVMENHQPILTNAAGEDPRLTGVGEPSLSGVSKPPVPSLSGSVGPPAPPSGVLPVSIRRFLSVPAMINKTFVGQISLAESDEDYTGYDLDVVKRLAVLYTLTLQRKRAEEQIETSLKEKEVLLREVLHRTKNNMQVINGLISLQSQYIKDATTLHSLQEIKNRIISMSLAHEKLYKSQDLSKIDLKDYANDLSRSLLRNYKTDTGKIRLHSEVDSMMVSLETAIPIGLILNELISNSLKHAFLPGKEGEISIRAVMNVENEIELTFKDNGIGLPEGLDIRCTDSLGLQLITTLAENQLHGKLEVERGWALTAKEATAGQQEFTLRPAKGTGTLFMITFKPLNYRMRH